jgi:cysteine desulfurase
MIYLDNSATTKPYIEVIKEMQVCMEDEFGNPSSLHHLGLNAEKRLKDSRRSLALLLGARAEEIIFTSGGTESDNAAIFGIAQTLKRRGNRIITSKIEHPAVLEAFMRLERMGFEAIYINVDQNGLIDLKELESAINERTILLSFMHVNNEIGTIQPIASIGNMKKRTEGLAFHVDAIQSFGKIPVDPQKCAVDLLSLSGHKIHGPKGIGALYLREGMRIEPLMAGGGQEYGLRPGTENLPGIAGFSVAAQQVCSGQTGKMKEVTKLRSYLLQGIKDQISDIRINSFEQEGCSPAILNISFEGTKGEVLLHMLEQAEIYVSTGSACSSKKKNRSHVLSAIGLNDSQIDSAIRFSLSEFNTLDEMEIVLDRLKTSVKDMRRMIRK